MGFSPRGAHQKFMWTPNKDHPPSNNHRVISPFKEAVGEGKGAASGPNIDLEKLKARFDALSGDMDVFPEGIPEVGRWGGAASGRRDSWQDVNLEGGGGSTARTEPGSKRGGQGGKGWPSPPSPRPPGPGGGPGGGGGVGEGFGMVGMDPRRWKSNDGWGGRSGNLVGGKDRPVGELPSLRALR